MRHRRSGSSSNWIESGDLCDWDFGFNTADPAYLVDGKLFNVQTSTRRFLSQTNWVSFRTDCQNHSVEA